MLFANVYRYRRDQSEADDARVLELFSNWQPPEGMEIKHWWFNANQTGIVIFEVDNAEVIAKTLAPWNIYFDWEVSPIVEIASLAELGGEAVAWRNSIS